MLLILLIKSKDSGQDGDWLQIHLQGARARSVGGGSRRCRCIRGGAAEDLPGRQSAESVCAPGSGLWPWHAAPGALVWRSVPGKGVCMSPQHSSLQDVARCTVQRKSRKHLKVSCLHWAVSWTVVTPGRVLAGPSVGHRAELRPGMAQAPHRAVKEGGALPESCGVFVSRWHHGSPAHRYALYALQFVQEVNGVPTPDLEAFVKAISSLVRLVCPMLTTLCSPRTAADIQTQNSLPFWTFPADSWSPGWQPDYQYATG